MTSSTTDKPDLLQYSKLFLETALKSIVFTIIWIPVYIFRSALVLFLQKTDPSIGKILDHFDSTVEENFTEEPPRNSLIFTLILDGPLEVSSLRSLFVKNVLEKKVHDKKTGQDKPLYPEYRQYQTEILGYKFWKNDSNFNIDNHIREEVRTEKNGILEEASIGKIHEEMTNSLFPKRRSPWEIILVKNYRKENGKTLLIYRSHHTLGDTKSILKVLVGLGQKDLRLPEAKYKEEGLIDKLKYFIMLPFYFVHVQVVAALIARRAVSSRLYNRGGEPLLHIGLSKQVKVSEIKAIAKKNHVTTSAVVMAAVSGAFGKCRKLDCGKDEPCQWVLPKPNHPDHLANYAYTGTMDLPTTISSPLERLQKCNEIFAHLKASNLYKYEKMIGFQLGTMFNPFREKYMLNTVFPLCITNIAGDTEGFSIGNRSVEEFTMTCAPVLGISGAIICAFSYKDVIELSATIKDGVLTGPETQALADAMANEFDVLSKV